MMDLPFQIQELSSFLFAVIAQVHLAYFLPFYRQSNRGTKLVISKIIILSASPAVEYSKVIFELSVSNYVHIDC